MSVQGDRSARQDSAPDGSAAVGRSASATELLVRLASGTHDRSEILNTLLPMIYDELHRLAASYLRQERPGHTLQPTALISEAYLRLVDQRSAFESRGHFLAVAATAMRRILVNHARDRGRLKRGGGLRASPLESDHTVVDEPDLDLGALDDALVRLSAIDPVKVQIVEMRYFIGLSVDETAAALGMSESTIKRQWQIARAWLRRDLESSAYED